MDNKEKKQTPFFKSVQISKEKREKFFKVHKNFLKEDNKRKENSNNNCSESNKEQSSNHFFITHKDIESNINKNSFDKINDVNNLNGIFIKNKNSSINNDNNNINNINSMNVLNNVHNIDENIYKSKINIVYFESIKNLCDNLNQNFDELNRYENIIDINEYLTQMYLKLKILDRKILLLNKINKIKVSQEDLHILNALLKHLLYMNKALNNNISNNIRIIYSNLNNLCDNFKG